MLLAWCCNSTVLRNGVLGQVAQMFSCKKTAVHESVSQSCSVIELFNGYTLSLLRGVVYLCALGQSHFLTTALALQRQPTKYIIHMVTSIKSCRGLVPTQLFSLGVRRFGYNANLVAQEIQFWRTGTSKSVPFPLLLIHALGLCRPTGWS